MEATALGMFMVSACVFGVLLEHIAGPANRVVAGIAMGLTAVAIISSPWGQRSGAHMNPAVTLTFLSLGKITPWDALFYAIAQFAGGAAGVLLSAWVLGPVLARVQFVATVPGPDGPWVAFAAEFAISFLLISIVLNVANSRRFTRFTPWVAFAAEFTISFLLISIVLRVSNSRRFTRFTPWVAGFLVASFISVESPLSGMSMNPARTVGSALSSGIWSAVWVLFLAPALAMLSAGQLYRHWRGAHRVFCAKYHHHNDTPCIFRCNYGAINEQ